MKNWIAKYSANKLVQNTGWMLLGQALTLFVQAAYFVIIARWATFLIKRLAPPKPTKGDRICEKATAATKAPYCC
jgi:hypothetical protein